MFTANGIAGPYWIEVTDKEIRVHGRHNAIVSRYPKTDMGRMCADEHLRRLMKGHDKAERKVRDAAPALLDAIKALVTEVTAAKAPGPLPAHMEAALAKAHAAIGKAEGVK